MVTAARRRQPRLSIRPSAHELLERRTQPPRTPLTSPAASTTTFIADSHSARSAASKASAPAATTDQGRHHGREGVALDGGDKCGDHEHSRRAVARLVFTASACYHVGLRHRSADGAPSREHFSFDFFKILRGFDVADCKRYPIRFKNQTPLRCLRVRLRERRHDSLNS